MTPASSTRTRWPCMCSTSSVTAFRAAASRTPTCWRVPCRPWTARSEEHTSELQSLRHLVCRLLLEKKKRSEQGLPDERRCARGARAAAIFGARRVVLDRWQRRRAHTSCHYRLSPRGAECQDSTTGY